MLYLPRGLVDYLEEPAPCPVFINHEILRMRFEIMESYICDDPEPCHQLQYGYYRLLNNYRTKLMFVDAIFSYQYPIISRCVQANRQNQGLITCMLRPAIAAGSVRSLQILLNGLDDPLRRLAFIHYHLRDNLPQFRSYGMVRFILDYYRGAPHELLIDLLPYELASRCMLAQPQAFIVYFTNPDPNVIAEYVSRRGPERVEDRTYQALNLASRGYRGGNDLGIYEEHLFLLYRSGYISRKRLNFYYQPPACFGREFLKLVFRRLGLELPPPLPLQDDFFEIGTDLRGYADA